MEGAVHSSVYWVTGIDFPVVRGRASLQYPQGPTGATSSTTSRTFSAPSRTSPPLPTCILLTAPSPRSTSPLPFNNTAFDTAFVQSFLTVVRALDPNAKFAPTITPQWDTWSAGHAEMLFNKTEADAPDVRAITTADALLERCRWVPLLLGCVGVVLTRRFGCIHSFWESVSALTGQ